ncbi:MAG: type II toxin-antitoxin system VapC family toxin [Blastocatellia bacterium]
MSVYYLDTSALVKRYVREPGSKWVGTLADTAAGHTIVTVEITRVEAAAAIAAKHRAPKGITRLERDAAVSLFLNHCLTQYEIVPLAPSVFSQAISLTQNHNLRGYDAVQLSAALFANQLLLNRGMAGLIFIAADAYLLQAASAENLPTDNPNLHP